MHSIGSYCLAAVVLAAAGPEPVPVPSAPKVVQQLPPDRAEAILGRAVAGHDGKTLGRLIDVLVDAAGTPVAAVIDFGGFLGVGNRRIAVRWDTLHFAPSDPQRAVMLDMTPDDLKAVPAYTDPTKPAPVVTSEPAPGAAAAAVPAVAPSVDGTADTAAKPAPEVTPDTPAPPR